MKKLNCLCATFIFLLLAGSVIFTSCADLYDENELDKTELCIASTGSDTTGDGTGIKPYKTLDKALRHIKGAGLGSSAEWIVYVLDEVICSQEISATNFIGSKLTLQGINSSSALNGNSQGSVLKITAPGTFVLKKIKITGGTGSNESGLKGGGIYLSDSNATVIISSDSTITINTAAQGGGIYINEGTVNLYGSVMANTAFQAGGGINNRGTVNLYGYITGNIATTIGGGIYNKSVGTVKLGGSCMISGNTAAPGTKPGIYNEENGNILNDNITNNPDQTEQG